MKHVIALDVSKGKSTIAIYDRYKQCEFEGELEHTRIDFEQLHQRIEKITALDGQAPEIIFEATGVYSKSVKKFLRDYNHAYCRMNPLEANLQMTSMRRHKTDISDAHELAKTHFKMDRKRRMCRTITMNKCERLHVIMTRWRKKLFFYAVGCMRFYIYRFQNWKS